MVAYLLEVGTEELPASFVQSALGQWQTLIPKALSEAHLTTTQIHYYGTPRRLAVLLEGLPECQPDRTEAIKGPPVNLAYKEGELTPAGQGFARKQGVSPEQLEIRQLDKGEFVFAIQQIQGQSTATVLQQISPSWITGLSGERLMRWGSGELKFPRPIRWLLSLLDNQILALELEGLQADRISLCHRVLHPDPITLDHAGDYCQALEAAYVQPCSDKRRQQIEADIVQAAATVKGVAEISDDLVAEVTQLVEWPTAVVGQFEPEYLQLPVPVIKTVMVTHQRYFPVFDVTQPEVLLPRFIFISNGDPTKSDIIAAGNGRVIRARLADAQFFYTEDQKHPLEQNLAKLEQVTFAENLGSVADKVRRIQEIATVMTHQLQLTATDLTDIQRTALLCKADLVTQMVYEFPELQGIMGADYAKRSGESTLVVEGIAQHYWPIGAGDPLPQSLTGQVVGLADRLDTLVGLFKLGKVPTGSSDPFALRRAATSSILIVWILRQSLNLYQLLHDVIQLHHADQQATLKILVEFFMQRIQTLLKDDKQIDYDLVNAIVGDSDATLAKRTLTDLQSALKRATYLQQLRQEGVLTELYPTLNRVARLAKQGNLDLSVLDPSTVIDRSLLKDPSETALYEACQMVYQHAQHAQQQQDFKLLITAFQSVAPTVSTFFDQVLVMDTDLAIRANRLNLLSILRNNASVLADFGAVVIAGE